MNYPVAVNGAMPFVDSKKYREQQIKKVIAKHRQRQRHSSGPEKYSLERSKIYTTNTKSLPQLSQGNASSPRMRRPRFISMPSLESQNNLANQEKDNTTPSSTKQRIIHSIKQFFTSSSKDSKTKYQPQYTQNQAASGRVRTHSAPVDILSKSRANVNSESNSPPNAASPKRQRTRTVSNISSVMETIEEIPENFVLEGDTTDSESDLESNTCGASLSSILSSLSEPSTISRLRLTHLDSSTEVICAV